AKVIEAAPPRGGNVVAYRIRGKQRNIEVAESQRIGHPSAEFRLGTADELQVRRVDDPVIVDVVKPDIARPYALAGQRLRNLVDGLVNAQLLIAIDGTQRLAN